MKRLLTLCVILSFAGCATNGTAVVCPVSVKEWSRDDQTAALLAMVWDAEHDPNAQGEAALDGMLIDYKNMRNQARACLKATD